MNDNTDTIELSAETVQHLINHIEHDFNDRDYELSETKLGDHVENAKNTLNKTETPTIDCVGISIYNIDRDHLCCDVYSGRELFPSITEANEAIENIPHEDTSHLELVKLTPIDAKEDPRTN